MTSTAGSPRRLAYLVLVASTSLGTLTSTIITSPVNQIAAGVGADARGIVLAVSAFTLAMVVFAPLAGWLCERLGARSFLVASLVVMMAAGAGAAMSGNLPTLVGMRVLQGLACSAIPPAVQQTLGIFWVEDRAGAMAGWASAIGVGQALGPPLGGVVAELVGWRGVFLTHAALCALMAVLLRLTVPAAPAGRPSLHVSGMLSLVIGVGGLVGGFASLGQGGPALATTVLAMSGAVGVLAYLAIARRARYALVDPRLLVERRYLRTTVAAGTVMACLGVVILATPLHLGRELHLSPSRIGAITVALAASMALFAPVSSRLGRRITPRRVLHAGLAVLVAGPLLLSLCLTLDDPHWAVASAFVVLVVTGCAIGSVQSVSAFGVMRSPAAQHGTALGIHNMMRFAGLAVGYSWVALSYPVTGLTVVYAGPAVLAGLALAVALVGPPAAPVVDEGGQVA